MSMTIKRIGGKDDGGIDFFGWWWLPHESSPNEETHHSSAVLRRRRIRVIGQCKAEKKKIGPNYIRELEGVLYRFLTQKFDDDNEDHPYLLLDDDDEGDEEMKTGLYSEFLASNENQSLPAIALLVSQSAFTKSTVLRANSSPIPFCLLHLPPVEPARMEENVVNMSGSDNDDESTPSSGNLLGSVWCNPALCGSKGLLKGRMEVRWERHLENVGGARPALWWDGVRLASWVPNSASVNTGGAELMG